MTEVPQNELALITKNYDLQFKLHANEVKYNSMQKVLIGCGIALYIFITVLAVAIQTTNKQANTITAYETYMDQQEIELQDYSNQLFLLKRDNHLLEELGK